MKKRFCVAALAIVMALPAFAVDKEKDKKEVDRLNESAIVPLRIR